jgi:hypothetical protein
VRAAEAELAAREGRDFERRQDFFRESARTATPSAERFPGRRFVHAEVVDRDLERIDRVVVELEGGSSEGLTEGLPVVSGEVYVGHVERLDQPLPGQALVALITGRGAFVGARVEPEPAGAADDGSGEPVRLVVGGIVPLQAAGAAAEPAVRGRPERYGLAVHNPSRADLPAGRLVVDESCGDALGGALGHAELANGFALGRLLVNGGDARRTEYAVEPLLDYRAGLFQLTVVAPAGIARGPETARLDVLEDPLGWREVSVTASFEPTPWRAGLKVGGGTWDGLREGAAVVSGVHLIGRVERASLVSADVALLGDPGLHLPALARIEGREQPLVLGSLACLGRGGDGRSVRLLWNAEAPRTLAEPARAEILTGSGEPGVPRGLSIGEATLPAGAGLHELLVELPVEARDLARLWVRIDAPEEPSAGEAAAP